VVFKSANLQAAVCKIKEFNTTLSSVDFFCSLCKPAIKFLDQNDPGKSLTASHLNYLDELLIQLSSNKITSVSINLEVFKAIIFDWPVEMRFPGIVSNAPLGDTIDVCRI
jgi:hypothetical protein